MIFRSFWVLAAIILAMACGTGEESGNAASEIVGLLPDETTLPGWRIADGPIVYDSVTLYEYLNGGAPLYLDFGFEELVHVRYQLGDDDMSSVTLDIFDMGSGLGAFGLCRSGRPADAEVRDWGAEGFRSGTVAAAWKGTISIHAEADDDRPELIETMERLVASVANDVVGGISPPAAVGLLPPAGLVPWSARIVARDLMSHEFLPGGVMATYRMEDKEGTLFFSELEDEAAVTEAMVKLRAHHDQWGEVVGEIDSIAGGGFRFSDPGLGTGVIVANKTHIVGAYGGFSDGMQMVLLTRLIERLDAS